MSIQIERPKEFSLTTAILLVLLLASAWVAIAIFQAISETTTFESVVFANPTAQHLVGAIDISSWKRYTNKTAGFTLRYPQSWYVDEVAVDPKTGGDVMDAGGKVSELFEISIAPASGFGISIKHVFPSYDNQPPNVQKDNTITLSRPLSGAYYELKSMNGAAYLRSYTQNSEEGDRLAAWIPTGKYIVSMLAINPSKAIDVQVFDAILKTIDLK